MSYEGFVPLSRLTRGAAGEAVDRTLRTTDDAIRFTAALAEALGPRGYACEWVRPGGSRRLYARDPERPDWIVAQAILELSLDVPPPPPWANQMELEDGTIVEIPRPKMPQPEGPNQRSGELRLIQGERVSQWSYDERGQIRERCRGRGDASDDSLPFLADPRLLDPGSQRPHDVFLRDDLDPDGHSVGELADKVAALDHAAHTAVRVRVPHPIPGGPALAARRAVWELRRASAEGRWSYPAAGWVVIDGYVGDVKATGATFEAAVAEWERAMAVLNPVPRDHRLTPAQLAENERRYEEALERMGDEDPAPKSKRSKDGKRKTVETRAVIRFEPPRQMPWPPHRPELAPAVAIRLPEPPALPPAWRGAGFSRVVRCIDETGRFGHGFYADRPDGGFLFVGEEAAKGLEPDGLVERLTALEREADAEDLRTWGERPFPDRGYMWRSSTFSVLTGGGRGVGPLKRTGYGLQAERPTADLEPGARFAVVWSRPR